MNRGALAGARALSAGGWQVGIGFSPRSNVTRSSRAASYAHAIPSAADEDAFIAAIAEAIEQQAYDVVFPVDEAQVLALSKRRDDLAAIVPYPAHANVVHALDRRELARAARAAGLATPAEINPDDGVPSGGDSPVVIKANRHAYRMVDGAAYRFETEILPWREAGDAVQAMRIAGVEPLVQERVEGHLVAIVALVDRDGAVRVMLQQEAERTWPLDAGISARARTVAVDPELRQGVEGLLRDLGWFGMVELQFLRAPDGIPKLIDFNPRFYGSLALALAAGVNLPHAWAVLATGGEVGEIPPARTGVRYQWLAGDVLCALAQGAGTAKRDLPRTLLYGLGAAHSVWSARDPYPFLATTHRILANRWARISPRRRDPAPDLAAAR